MRLRAGDRIQDPDDGRRYVEVVLHEELGPVLRTHEGIELTGPELLRYVEAELAYEQETGQCHELGHLLEQLWADGSLRATFG